ncbi:Glyoxylase, beta-lactamase superfamily II [Deinococcus reticulitermitis]|uniref:Glyoxylase, beta-lactamase superfamily II n=1 Tax=Deinococcus reticulitermitis TaxID=856736 RepID=A0A1H6WJE2_9DEIO|nr:MBL fold metallo-hydrolase [Deinococcus reticulitermitis]SEJ17003.1 Glyoxylase, beta-lactamase superfamily II [Deinococcus reticulitermitis]
MPLTRPAPGVGMARLYANVFLIRSPQGRLLVDTGTVRHAATFARLLRAFEPDAVLLTHSHVDHGGNAFLAARRSSLLAHPLEHARLSGQSHDLPYPAGRPQVGSLISRLHPKVPVSRLRAVQPGEDVLGWEVIHLPGHTDGQIGLRREGVLIAADAVLSRPTGAHLPRAAYNWDHGAALRTLREISEMDLDLILPGHGAPLSPAQVRARAERDADVWTRETARLSSGERAPAARRGARGRGWGPRQMP